jgi:hypothetical protein
MQHQPLLVERLTPPLKAVTRGIQTHSHIRLCQQKVLQHLPPILHQNFRTSLAVGIAVLARVVQGLQVVLDLPLLIQQTLVTLAVVIAVVAVVIAVAAVMVTQVLQVEAVAVRLVMAVLEMAVLVMAVLEMAVLVMAVRLVVMEKPTAG